MEEKSQEAAATMFMPRWLASRKTANTKLALEMPQPLPMTTLEGLKYLGLPPNAAHRKGDEYLVSRYVGYKDRCKKCLKSPAEAAGCPRNYLKYEGGVLVEYTGYCDKGETYERQHRIDSLALKSGLDMLFRDRQFDNFYPNYETQAVYDGCKKFCSICLENPIGTKGLCLIGNTGCGKTHLAAAILNEMQAKGIVGIFLLVADYLATKRKSFDDPSLKSTIDKLEQDVRSAPLLILDDLGVETPSPWTKEQLFLIIDARYRAKLPLIITSNYDLHELESRIGSRAVSRISEITNIVKINTPDYRIKKACNSAICR